MTIPLTKISATIRDFGEPLLSQFDETPPIDAIRGGGSMRYNEFREGLERALTDANLFPSHHFRIETINTSTTDRNYEIIVGHDMAQRARPFHVTAILSHRWSPFESARSYTTEEDLLTELFGRKARLSKTTRRWLRMDVVLNARLPDESAISLGHVRARWHIVEVGNVYPS